MSTTYAAVSTATTTAATSMGAATSMDAATSMGDVDATIPVLDAALGAGAAFDMELTFHPADYTLFVLMMLMSALIGVYYGCYKRQDSVSEYLHGGKTMSVLPVAMSLISSNISGITMLAVPAEMYLYGTQFALLGIMVFPAVIVVMYWFLPMFFNLQCNSSFEGGVKAVIWTDALQLFLLVLASVAVIVLGVVRLGGLGVLLERSLEGGRIEFFNMDPNPYTRCTFWNVGVGACVTIILNMGAGPSSVQRFLSVPTLADARRTSVYLAFGYFLTKLFSVLTGLIIFASYFYCDPLDKSVGAVRKGDQLVPYFVMDVGRDYPGLSGLFVAGVFSAALSTMSGGLNTLSGTLYTDFIEKYLPKKVSDERASTHMKLVSLVIGAFCVGMIFVVENLGGVLQVAISFMGITAGAAYGLFFLGMFFPTVNSKVRGGGGSGAVSAGAGESPVTENLLQGALVGAYTCLVVMVVTVGGNSLAMYNDSLKYPHLPTRTDGCLPNSTLDANFPTASPDAPSPHDADVFPLFKVSYLYFSVLGVAVTTVVALCVSACTGGNNLQTADPDLFSPAVARFLPRHRKNAKEAAAAAAAVTMKEYEAVPGADK
ncbi:hypothetical protein FOCC_FOCC000347 [Frankliniella occidentalis]|nr:hypothetical protein FOCC_FOCC000347 [Frankliniella occidentalis]